MLPLGTSTLNKFRTDFFNSYICTVSVNRSILLCKEQLYNLQTLQVFTPNVDGGRQTAQTSVDSRETTSEEIAEGSRERGGDGEGSVGRGKGEGGINQDVDTEPKVKGEATKATKKLPKPELKLADFRDAYPQHISSVVSKVSKYRYSNMIIYNGL